MTIECTSWDVAKAEVFRQHTMTIMGGPHDGVVLTAAILTTSSFMSKFQAPSLAGVTNDEYKTFSTTGSLGFIGHNGDVYYWPGRMRATGAPRLHIINGGRPGKPQVWVRKQNKISTKSSKPTKV